MQLECREWCVSANLGGDPLSRPPTGIKLYHIIHADKLASVINGGHLFCDTIVATHIAVGTTIGMTSIKERRLSNPLHSHPGLHVGECVPFYFCPRSVMLYLLYMGNHPDLTYRGGQTPILHLQVDLKAVVEWATANRRKWAFTLSNAGARFFEDRSNLAQLNEINWEAVRSNDFRDPDIKEGKQAEFLVEHSVPWTLVEEIGMHGAGPGQQVLSSLHRAPHRPPIHVRPEWYY